MWQVLLPAVMGGLGIAASAASANSAAKAQKSANRTNVDLAREQMEFQERMSNTAHQREVKDLREAGLNPILSANAGSSTPPGGLPHVESEFRDVPAAVNTVVSSAKNAVESRLNMEAIKTQQSIQDTNSAQAAKSRAEAIAILQNVTIKKPTASVMDMISGAFGKIGSSARYIKDTWNSTNGYGDQKPLFRRRNVEVRSAD